MSHSYYHGNEYTESPKKIKSRTRVFCIPFSLQIFVRVVNTACSRTGSNPRDVLRGVFEIRLSFLIGILFLGDLTDVNHIAGMLFFLTPFTGSDVRMVV